MKTFKNISWFDTLRKDKLETVSIRQQNYINWAADSNFFYLHYNLATILAEKSGSQKLTITNKFPSHCHSKLTG